MTESEGPGSAGDVEFAKLLRVVDGPLTNYCRARLRGAHGLQLDPDDLKQHAYAQIQAKLDQLPTLNDRRRYLFETVRNMVFEAKRRTVSKSCAFAVLRVEYERSKSRSVAPDHYVADRELLERIVNNVAQLLPQLPFFRSQCYILRSWLGQEYAGIANVFSVALGERPTVHSVQERIIESIRTANESVLPTILGAMALMAPSPQEIAELCGELKANGDDYWHDIEKVTQLEDSKPKVREFRRLRTWRHHVNVRVQDFLKTCRLNDQA